MAPAAPTAPTTEPVAPTAPAAPVDRVAELTKAIEAARTGSLQTAQRAIAQLEKAGTRETLPEAFQMLDASLASAQKQVDHLTQQLANEQATQATAKYVGPMVAKFGKRRLRSADVVNTSIPATIDVLSVGDAIKATSERLADLTEYAAILAALAQAVDIEKLPAEIADVMPPVHFVKDGSELTIKIAPKSGGRAKASGEGGTHSGPRKIVAANPEFAQYIGMTIGLPDSKYPSVKAFLIGEFPAKAAAIESNPNKKPGEGWTGVSAPAVLQGLAGIQFETLPS